MERILIRINKVCVSFTNSPHHFVECSWVQQVVMVKQSNIIALGHLQAGVGVAGYAQVFLQLFILDSLVFPHILTAYFFYVAMCLVTAVCHAQLPVAIGLVNHRLDHFTEEQLRCVIKRDNDAEQDVPRELVTPLLFQLFSCK